MLSVSKDFNGPFKALKTAIQQRDMAFKVLFGVVHGLVHDHSHIETFQTQALHGITQVTYQNARTKSYKNARSIAFLLYHMTRIEDICASVLIEEPDAVFFKDGWADVFNFSKVDTGNAWTDHEIDLFRQSVRLNDLLAYRKSVCNQTRSIVEHMSLEDLNRSVSATQIQKLVLTKSIDTHEDAIWLLDYWGKKTKGELLLMPLSRHAVVHFNDIIKMKKYNK